MKRLLSVLLIICLVVSSAACSSKQTDSMDPSPPIQQEAAATEAPQATATPEPTPEPEPQAPMDLFDIEFNPFAETEFPDNLTIVAASFRKGSVKMEGKNPFILSLAAEGNMFAAVAYQADIAGLSEQEKGDRFNDYSEYGYCEFTGTDGRLVTIRQQKPHDDQHENGACTIELTYYVPAEDTERYTALIRDNYNFNALRSVQGFFNTDTDFAECSIEVNLQKKEAIVAVQYYVDDAEAMRQRVSEIEQVELREWYGLPAAGIRYGLVENTLIFDSRFGAAVLILQTSHEVNTSVGTYVEPEVSLVKLGFGFDDAGTCGVFEQHEPHYMNVAIHKPEWGDFNEDWNVEYLDQVNGYGLRITYNIAEGKYFVTLDSKSERAAFEYYPATNEYAGQYPDMDTLTRMFNDAFGTEGEDFYDKPIAYFKQLVQERFQMSVDELYALPKQ